MSETPTTEPTAVDNPPDPQEVQNDPLTEMIEDLANSDKKEKTEKKKRNNKKKSGQWKNAKQNTWIYIQNLPEDVTEEILDDVFKRYGIIQQNMDGTPRIRIYRDENGKPKGDASICYLRKESIQLAIQMHDDAPLRYSDSQNIRVSEAVFQKKQRKEDTHIENEDEEKAKKLRWMHLQQQKQSLSWADEDEDAGGVGLRIIVIKNMFSLEETTNPNFKSELTEDVRQGCEPFGPVDKITIFDRNADGIVVVKFKSALAASNCVKKMDGRFFAGRKLSAFFWDGHTDYRVKMDEEEENEKLENFAKWIEEESFVSFKHVQIMLTIIFRFGCSQRFYKTLELLAFHHRLDFITFFILQLII